MAHRFGPRKGSRKERPEPETKPEAAPDKDLLDKDLLGEGLLGKDLLGEGLLGKDSGTVGKDQAPPLKKGGLGRRPLGRKGIPTREMPTIGSGRGIPWLAIAASIILIGLIGGLGVGYYLKNQVPGYTATVFVKEPTRLDWVFATSEEGKSGPPPGLKAYFDTPRLSQYELFVPASYETAGDKRYPLVLFLSPTERPVGWSRWSSVCTEQGIIFAGVRESGRVKQSWQQARMALDVLDEVRKNYRIDTDRCYIAGQAEGAQLACKLAFSLPEVFGGVVAIDQADFARDVREEAWLRHRVVDRLSVALVTGESSEDRGVIEKLFVPYFKDIGVRSKCWPVPGLGDSVPPSDTLAEIFGWLEEDLPRRQELAKRHPASRLDDAPNGKEWSQRVFDEANRRLTDTKNPYPGVAQLRGLARRWAGTEAAEKAGQLYVDRYLTAEDWKDAEKADLVRQDLAIARAMTAYLTAPTSQAHFDRHWQRNFGEWGPRAKQAWTDLATRDPMYAEEAKNQIAEIDKALKRTVTAPNR